MSVPDQPHKAHSNVKDFLEYNMGAIRTYVKDFASKKLQHDPQRDIDDVIQDVFLDLLEGGSEEFQEFLTYSINEDQETTLAKFQERYVKPAIWRSLDRLRNRHRRRIFTGKDGLKVRKRLPANLSLSDYFFDPADPISINRHSLEEEDIQSLVDKTAKSWKERKIIRMRMEGHTLREIQEETGVGKNVVQRLFKKLQKKFDHLLDS